MNGELAFETLIKYLLLTPIVGFAAWIVVTFLHGLLERIKDWVLGSDGPSKFPNYVLFFIYGSPFAAAHFFGWI
jgi:hypothetical protein